MIRSLLIALAALAVAAPTANAAFADRFIPYVDASDDVHVGTTKGETYLRFGPKAAKRYRALAGKAYTYGCQGAHTGGGGDRFPRKRSRIFLGDGNYDVCFVSTALRGSDERCLLGRFTDLAADERPQCIRLIVAFNDKGRTFVDAYMRTWEIASIFFDEDPLSFAELQKDLGADVVALPGPDASPPLGKVGHFDDGHTRVVAALLADGTRRFARMDGDVYSSNVPALYGTWDLLTLF